MNIIIDDNEMARLLAEEIRKVSTRSMFGESSLEKAIKNAVQEIVKDRIKIMIHEDKALMITLKKGLEDNIGKQMEKFGQKVAKAICDQLEEGVEAEFRTYE